MGAQSIPHDVMAAAWPIALDIVSQSQAVEAAQFAIARAIYAERERCVAVAETHGGLVSNEPVGRACARNIARAIKGA